MKFHMPRSLAGRILPIALVVALILSGFGLHGSVRADEGSQAPPEPTRLGPAVPLEVSEHAHDWPVSTGNYAGHRAVFNSPISADSVDQLAPAWAFQIPGIGGYGAITGVPVVVGETVYLQDMMNNVFALDRASGAVKWAKYFDLPAGGPNGVAVAYGMVFGGLGTDASAFALDARTGEELWRTTLDSKPEVGSRVVPVVYDSVVYIGTVPTTEVDFYKGGSKGAIYALAAETGNILWSWATTADNLWGNARLNSGGGLWYPPSIDEHGNLYAGIGNPGPWPGIEVDGTPYPNGSSRPGDNLYTSSMVSLDPTNGSLRWYHQAKPHDLFDHDFQNTPVLATVTIDGVERQLAIGSGKTGTVIAADANTGEVLWTTPVGMHQNDELTAIPNGESVEVYPGALGGVETPIAFADGTVFVATINLPTTVTSLTAGTDMNPAAATSNFVAINAADGSIKWDVEVPTMLLGGAAVANDVVFTAGLDGLVRGFATVDGTQIWSYQAPAGINAPLAIAGATLFIPAGTFMFPPLGGYTEAQPAPPEGPVQFRLLALRLDATGPMTEVAAPEPVAAETPIPVPVAEVAADAAETVSEEAVATTEGEGETYAPVTIDMVDLAFVPKELTIPADTDVRIVLPNIGAVTHDFTIDALDIQVTARSGETGEVVINAPAGTYEFYCSISGHKQAGMVGTLIIE